MAPSFLLHIIYLLFTAVYFLCFLFFYFSSCGSLIFAFLSFCSFSICNNIWARVCQPGGWFCFFFFMGPKKVKHNEKTCVWFFWGVHVADNRTDGDHFGDDPRSKHINSLDFCCVCWQAEAVATFTLPSLPGLKIEIPFYISFSFVVWEKQLLAVVGCCWSAQVFIFLFTVRNEIQYWGVKLKETAFLLDFFIFGSGVHPKCCVTLFFFPSIKNEYFLWIAARYFSVLFYDVYLFYGRTGDMKRPGGTPFGCDRSIWHVICYIVMKGNNEGFLFLRHNRVSSTTTVSHIFQFNIVHWFRYSFRRRICRTTLYES